MRCRDATGALSAHIDDELPGGTRRALDAHLAGCPECRTLLAELRLTVRAVRLAFGAGQTPADAGLPEPVVQAVLAAVRRLSPP